MILSNLHTHTRYCDGTNTPDELARRAAELGFKSLGFSSHSYTAFDPDFCMPKENYTPYITEIQALKEKYRGKTDIYMGLERDVFSKPEDIHFDYIIGSVHYILKNGAYLSIDDTAEIMQSNVNEYFSGNFQKYAEAYYSEYADILAKTKADIIGHFDLITKFNEGEKYFSEHSKKYRDIVLSALEPLTRENCIFELNTGAVASGCKSAPYPAPFILEFLKERGCRITVSSDCHDARLLDFGFNNAEKLLKAIGFKDITVLENGKFIQQPINL